MSEDVADLDAIRQRKLERLQAGVDTSGDLDVSRTDADPGTDRGVRTPDEPIAIDSADSFGALLDRHDVVLADFSATWCGPCRTLEPIVERVAARSPGAVATIDIDANRDLAQRYNVRGVPTLLLFADGDRNPVERLVGVQDEAILVDLVEQYAN